MGEKIKYWMPGEKPTRSQRKLKSDIKQQQRNEANAEKKLARTLNENFSHADHLLRLSYAEEAFAAWAERKKNRKRCGRMRTGSSSSG